MRRTFEGIPILDPVTLVARLNPTERVGAALMSNAGTLVAGAGATQQRPQRQYWEIPSVYELDFLTLNGNSTQSQNVQIQADSDFKWTKAMFLLDVAGGAITANSIEYPKATVQIQDGGIQRNLFSAPVPVTSFFGVPGLPFILPMPYVFKARSIIQVTVASIIATNYASLRLSFIGTRCYQGGQPQ